MKKVKKSKRGQVIGVVGLGYIGLPLAAAFARSGFRVLGIDIDRKKIKKLNQTYKSSIYEPGLNETLQCYKNRIRFTSEQSAALKECDVIVITVGTPMSNKSRPDFGDVNNVTKTIGQNLQKDQLIILKSTVLPGVTRDMACQLEKLSGLKAGKDFYVVFSPERTLEGKVLKELYTLPKIVGGINLESQKKGVAVIKKLGGKIIKVSSLEIAEMCKCIDNSYRVVNITFANEIGDICEKNGIDSYEIIKAVNEAYPRTNMFFPGLGAGGPCLSKDPKILNYYAERNNIKTKMINASIVKSHESTMRLAPMICQFIKKNKIKKPKISLLGLAFKGSPATNDIRNSPAVDLYQVLEKRLKNSMFNFYDPIVKSFLSHKVAKDLRGCLKNSHVAIFLTNHPVLKNIDSKNILRISKRPLLVIDCWHNLLNLDKIQDKKVKVFRIGDSSQQIK